MVSKEKSKFKDIYSGEVLTVWEDEGFVWLSFPYVTINVPKEDFEILKRDLVKLGEM